MENIRKYGTRPFATALIHGGPGAAGEMSPLALELSRIRGILEPLQTAFSVDGQTGELKEALLAHADLPVCLVGFSWGAWLAYVLAARHPELVAKLILISSPSFDPGLASQTQSVRFERLSGRQRLQVENLQNQLGSPLAAKRNQAFAGLGAILSAVDAYDPAGHKETALRCDFSIYQKVWPEAEAMRKTGELLELGKRIRCPVAAVHGDFDPHPAAGVREPLSAVLNHFRFILLEHCGHKPWIERQAKTVFYQVLQQELPAKRN